MNPSARDLLQQEIGQHIAVPIVISAARNGDKISGRFKSGNRVYSFLLRKKELIYNPSGRSDSDIMSLLLLSRIDGIQRTANAKCTVKSYQCGKICLGIRRRCRKSVNDVERISKILDLLEVDTRTGNTILSKSLSGVSESDKNLLLKKAEKLRSKDERDKKAQQLREQRKEKRSKLGYINYSGGKAEDGKIQLVDYRKKGVNAYIAKLSGTGDRKFINDNGAANPDAFKGKEVVKTWDIKKLEDGVYEAQTRKGIGSRGVEKAYFSIKNGAISEYFDDYRQAQEAFKPASVKLSKPELQGASEKQIKYAESVRDKIIAQIESKGLTPQQVQKVLSNPQTQDARWWLDNKDTAVSKIMSLFQKKV